MNSDRWSASMEDLIAGQQRKHKETLLPPPLPDPAQESQREEEKQGEGTHPHP